VIERNLASHIPEFRACPDDLPVKAQRQPAVPGSQEGNADINSADERLQQNLRAGAAHLRHGRSKFGQAIDAADALASGAVDRF
jgi:hypothetical protein